MKDHGHDTSPRGAFPEGQGRRGVLLLVVLSMLTLFLMLGAAYVVTATRAREAARAYARLALAGDEVRVPHARLLDEVLLRIVAGRRAPVPSNRTTVSDTFAFSTVRFESLLADKYGAVDQFGTLVTLIGTNGPVSTLGPYLVTNVTLNGSSLRPGMRFWATDLVGRLLTFCEPGRPVTTHRIIRAIGMPGGVASAANPVVLAGAAIPVRLTLTPSLKVGPAVLPKPGRIIINGREFSGRPTPGYLHPAAGYRGHLVPLARPPANCDGLASRALPSNESWDGFDAHNGFLAQLQPTGADSTSRVVGASLLPPSTEGVTNFRLFGNLAFNYSSLSAAFDHDNDLIPDAADNDGDGVYDGVFLDWGLPDATDANGNVVEFRAAVLVVDLDGRFNPNVHGSLPAIVYSTGAHPGWSTHANLPREDLNSNGLWENEDKNNNDILDPAEDANGNGIIDANEDKNNNGVLDPAEDENGNGMLDEEEDINRNRQLDAGEDVNGNGKIDGDLNFNGKCDDYRLVGLGSGYGPADIQANAGFGNAPKRPPGSVSDRMYDGASLQAGSSAATSENPKLFAIVGGNPANQLGLRPATSRYSSAQVTPRLPTLEGKYGEKVRNSWTLSSTATMAGMTANNGYARPGLPDLDDPASRSGDRRAPLALGDRINFGVPPRWWNGVAGFSWADDGTNPLPRGTFNSPPDLQGRLRTLTVSPTTGDIVPQLAIANPEWSNGLESTDDPYELRLDTRQGWGGWLHDPQTVGDSLGVLAHNPFTLAELEPILRPYDGDTNRLPPRLAAILGSAAEYARLRVTTDAWDTTAVVGSGTAAVVGTGTGQAAAAQKLFVWLRNFTGNRLFSFKEDANDNGILDPGEDINSNGLLDPPALTGAINGEIARGERFDLNRPFQESLPANAAYDFRNPYFVQRQAYFKDLFTLLYILADEDPNRNGQLDAGEGEDANGNNVRDPVAAVVSDLAQWAANVVEFRDADSRMTPFEYDIDPLNGWDVDGNVLTDEGGDRRLVWGAERPEILIRETLAWENGDDGKTTGGTFIAIHRPWNAVAYGTASTWLAGEPCDVTLDTPLNGTGRPTNTVDLGRKPSAQAASGTNPRYGDGSATRYPVWRLRLVGGGATSYIRLDTGTTSTPTLFVSATVSASENTVTNGDRKPKLGANQTLVLLANNVIKTPTGDLTVTMTTGSHVIATGTAVPFRVPGPLGGASGTARWRPATVYLERLSNPATELVQGAAGDDAVWEADPGNPDLVAGIVPHRYVIVDSATMSVINTGTNADETEPLTEALKRLVLVRSTTNATTAFWKTEFTGTSLASFPREVTGTTNRTQWFVWPNRPFVSPAELMLVPQGDSRGMLQHYAVPSASVQGSVSGNPVPGIPVPLHLFFDTVQVPSRFAGVNATCSADFVSDTGISTLTTTVAQVPAFREPGRVNLNTVTAPDVWNSVVGLTASGTLAMTAEILRETGAAGFVGSSPQASRGARTLAGMLSLNAANATASAVTLPVNTYQTGTITSSTDLTRPALALERNPLHAIATVSRLANTVTPRSNLFAIWVTLRESVPLDPDSVRYRRAFYIVDRSIPVGFEPPEDLDGDGVIDPPESSDRGNGILDSVWLDRNNNNAIDPGEWVLEDLNGNGILDPGEDLDGDGELDPSEDLNENRMLDAGEDLGDGVLDAGEDRNGNGILDPQPLHNVWDCVRLRRIIE